MTITGLSNYLRKQNRHIGFATIANNYDPVRGKRIAIDTASFMYRYTYGMEKEDDYIERFLSFVDHLRANNCKFIFIFDGKTHASKGPTLVKRRQAQQVQQKLAEANIKKCEEEEAVLTKLIESQAAKVAERALAQALTDSNTLTPSQITTTAGTTIVTNVVATTAATGTTGSSTQIVDQIDIVMSDGQQKPEPTDTAVGDNAESMNEIEKELKADTMQSDTICEDGETLEELVERWRVTVLQREYALKRQQIQSFQVKVTKQHYYRLMDVFRQHKIPYAEADLEAEKACAWLGQRNIVDYVVTEDFDALACGAPCMLRQWLYLNKGKRPKIPQLVSLNEVLSGLEMTQQQFVDACILSGTDFCKPPQNCAMGRAMNAIKQHKTLEKAFEMTYRKMYRSQAEANEGLQNFLAARRLFTDPTVPFRRHFLAPVVANIIYTMCCLQNKQNLQNKQITQISVSECSQLIDKNNVFAVSELKMQVV